VELIEHRDLGVLCGVERRLMARSGVTVRSRIPQLGAELRRRTSEVVRKTAFDVEGSAKGLVPVDTGNLKDNIQAQKVEDTLYLVNAGTEYARRVELGFKDADSLGRVYDQAGQPYMRPAAEKHRKPYTAAMRQIGKGLRGL